MDAEDKTEAWIRLRDNNRFGILAEDSFPSSNTGDDQLSPISTSTPTNSPPPSPSNRNQPNQTKQTETHPDPIRSDSEDSAIQSGEEENRSPTPQKCNFCPNPSENNPQTTLTQHILEKHTLVDPQPPTTSPEKTKPEVIMEPRCSVSGKLTKVCHSSCTPGNHYAPTAKLSLIREMENKRGYKWEPHTCKEPSRNPRQKPEIIQPVEEPATRVQSPPPHNHPTSKKGKPHATTFERLKGAYKIIDTWMCVWKIVAAILLCTGRYFLTPSSYKPLAEYPTALAQLMPILHWLLMGAFIFSARRQSHHTRTADAVQKEDNAETAEFPLDDKAELEEEDAELEKVNREDAEVLPEEDEIDAETQPQPKETPRRDIQEELLLMKEILIHGIKLRDPQSWSQMERLLVSRRDASL